MAVPDYFRQPTQLEKVAKGQSQSIHVQYQQEKDDHTVGKYEADEKGQDQDIYVQQEKNDHTIEDYEKNEAYVQHEKDEVYVQHEKDEAYVQHEKDEAYVQHEKDEEKVNQYFENLTINAPAPKDEAFNVQIVPSIESSAATDTSANLMINAPKDEAFNAQSVTSPNVEINEQFTTSLGVLDANELSTATDALANGAFRHRLTSLNETSSIGDMGTDTDEKDTSDATDSSDTADLSDAVDFSDAADQISDNSFSDFSEFKDLLIDLGTAFRSTKDMQTLQHLDPFIKFDTSTAGSVNFIIVMGSTASVGSVNLNTPMGIG